MNTLRSPVNSEEFEKYFQLRWQVLRKPWQQVQGSEQDELELQALHRMIIDDNQQVLAVGRLEKSDHQQGQIRYMAVCETVQGQGFGQQIIKELEKQASQLGFTQLLLNARENALNFYQKLGYQKQGYSHTLFDDIKHYKMTKTINMHRSHDQLAAQNLQNVWHQTIPLSKAMNIQISYFDGEQLMTHCDSEFNKNLHNTMFAGSIYTLATLTGWGWIYLTLQSLPPSIDGNIVLAEGNIRYHKPIKGLTYAKVVAENVSGELEDLALGKSAHVELVAQVYCGENTAATFKGRYVVLPKNKGRCEK
ncbi:MAG: bifunctional GNAT family N-acetyltransferase/hotdog fold thioesterase [Litorilituus sp.]|jgi:thioesterase domain-containing protein|nr:bifunctional GNAT family N-acetyltransferase/hotdog fold thioesterase [Litorilituus sp.]